MPTIDRHRPAFYITGHLGTYIAELIDYTATVTDRVPSRPPGVDGERAMRARRWLQRCLQATVSDDDQTARTFRMRLAEMSRRDEQLPTRVPHPSRSRAFNITGHVGRYLADLVEYIVGVRKKRPAVPPQVGRERALSVRLWVCHRLGVALTDDEDLAKEFVERLWNLIEDDG